MAYISFEFPPDNGKGGIGTYVKQIATAMVSKGVDIHVFAGSPSRTMAEQVNGFQVNWVKCSDGIDFKMKVVNSFATQHKLSPFDVMESPEIGGNAWDLKKRFPEVPLIVRLHTPGYLVESLKKRYIPFFAKARFVLGALRRVKWDMGYWRKYKKESDPDFQFTQLADYITAPSVAIKDWVVQHWKISPGKITVIPNIFLPSDDFLQIPVYKEAMHKRVIFFGRLNVLKGLVNATKAMSKILKEYPDWKFIVIGDDGNGPYPGATMRSWMSKIMSPVLPQLTFVEGMAYELIPAAIADAEIVLLPSLFESFSYTCAEAMAAGKAIVGSNTGGMRDLIENNESGVLIDPGNYKEIYSALKMLIDDNLSRYEFAQNARKRLLEHFNSEMVGTRFYKYYQQTVQPVE